jgi:hypothetical protein
MDGRRYVRRHLFIMRDYTKWKRLNLEPPGQRSLSETEPERRRLAEEETNKDLRKPIQQLICDVQEETRDPHRTIEQNLVHATARMVSMMGRVALEHERNSTLLIRLTWVLVVFTLAIVCLTVVMLVR